MAEMPKEEMMPAALMDLFEEVNVVKMHLFGTAETKDYPYAGKAMGSEATALLSDGLQPADGQKVYACYFTENSHHFILRIPNEKAANNLVLAKWDKAAEKLVKVSDLAYLHCNENTCQQQDAWLADLDDSRTLELILRRHTRDAKGEITNESFEVLTDDGMGHFKKTNEQLASLAVKEYYVMQ